MEENFIRARLGDGHVTHFHVFPCGIGETYHGCCGRPETLIAPDTRHMLVRIRRKNTGDMIHRTDERNTPLLDPLQNTMTCRESQSPLNHT